MAASAASAAAGKITIKNDASHDMLIRMTGAGTIDVYVKANSSMVLDAAVGAYTGEINGPNGQLVGEQNFSENSTLRIFDIPGTPWAPDYAFGAVAE